MAKKAKQKKPSAKADVENYVHEEAKRKNIPTAENQKLVADENKAIAPMIDDLARELAGQATICKVNVEAEPAIAERFGVQALPSLVFLKSGQRMDTLVGRVPMETLWHAVPSFPTVSEVWLRLLEAYGL